MEARRCRACRRAIPVLLTASSTFAVLAGWVRSEPSLSAAIVLLAIPTIAGIVANLPRPRRRAFILDGFAATVTVVLILVVADLLGSSEFDAPWWLLGVTTFVLGCVPPLLLVGVVSLLFGRNERRVQRS